MGTIHLQKQLTKTRASAGSAGDERLWFSEAALNIRCEKACALKRLSAGALSPLKSTSQV